MISSLILAAGFSSRMGEDKAFLSFEEKPVILHLIRKLEQFSNVKIVAGHNFERISKLKIQAKFELFRNMNPEFGMFSSISLANQFLNKHESILIQMVDQPFVSMTTYQKLLLEADNNIDIIQPCNSMNRPGHPIIITESARIKINDFLPTDSFRDLYKVLSKKFIEVDDKEIFGNYNTPEKWKSFFQK